MNYEHAARQAYIALGFALGRLRPNLRSDSIHPMEGFDPLDKVDEILVTAGPRSAVGCVAAAWILCTKAFDWLLPMKKVRKPDDRFSCATASS